MLLWCHRKEKLLHSTEGLLFDQEDLHVAFLRKDVVPQEERLLHTTEGRLHGKEELFVRAFLRSIGTLQVSNNIETECDCPPPLFDSVGRLTLCSPA